MLLLFYALALCALTNLLFIRNLSQRAFIARHNSSHIKAGDSMTYLAQSRARMKPKKHVEHLQLTVYYAVNMANNALTVSEVKTYMQFAACVLKC